MNRDATSTCRYTDIEINGQRKVACNKCQDGFVDSTIGVRKRMKNKLVVKEGFLSKACFVNM